MRVAPTAVHDVTLHYLANDQGLDQLALRIVACCLDSYHHCQLFTTCVNFDAVTREYSRNDLASNPVLGLVYASIVAFKGSWVPGNPWPMHRNHWIQAVQPHLDAFLAARPEVPESFKTEVLMAIYNGIPLAGPGDYDLVCDGLIDYILAMRYKQAENLVRQLAPGKRREVWESIPRTINIPGNQVVVHSSDDLVDKILAAAQPTHPIYSGVNRWDVAYGNRMITGDASLVFSHPGGGKSIWAGQTVAHTAAKGHLCCLVTTEVEPETFLLRMCSAHTGIDYKVLTMLRGSGTNMNGHPRLDEFRNWVRQVGRYIHIVRYRDIAGTDFRDKMQRIMEGFHRKFGALPHYTVMDWIGGSLSESFETAWDKREKYNEVANYMALDMADDLKMVTLTLAQAATETKNKANYSDQDTAESKALSRPMENAMGITSLMDLAENGEGGEKEQHKKRQFFCVPKCREGETLRIPVDREFGRMTFVGV